MINGGAALAILAFVGQIAGKPLNGLGPVVEGALDSLMWFVMGALFGVITAGLSYLAQLAFTDKANKLGRCFQVSAIVVGFA